MGHQIDGVLPKVFPKVIRQEPAQGGAEGADISVFVGVDGLPQGPFIGPYRAGGVEMRLSQTAVPAAVLRGVAQRCF